MTEATEDIPDWLWAFNPTVHGYPHDTGMARQQLREAGWRPGPDGIMRKNGEALDLVMVTNNSNATRRQAALRDSGNAATKPASASRSSIIPAT